MNPQNLECCPKFKPTKWEEKILKWHDKKFVKGRVPTLLYMPINFGKVIAKLMVGIEKAGAKAEDWMTLSDHTSKWNMDIYLAVDREIPGLENTTLSGDFFSKVYEGDFKNTEKWCHDFEKIIEKKGMTTDKLYMWYTTCPKCAKKYGKNYVVIVGKMRKKAS